MRLLLFHPGAASIDCEDCQRKWYDLETGKPKTYTIGQNQEVKEYEGPQFCPCKNGQKCPKGNPEEAKKNTLSKRNEQVLTQFFRHRVSPKADLTEAEKENFAIIDAIYQEFDQTILVNRLANELTKIVQAVRR